MDNRVVSATASLNTVERRKISFPYQESKLDSFIMHPIDQIGNDSEGRCMV
jgi:hypothetical protein